MTPHATRKLELIAKANARSVAYRQIVGRRCRIRVLRDDLAGAIRRYAWISARNRADWVGR